MRDGPVHDVRARVDHADIGEVAEVMSDRPEGGGRGLGEVKADRAGGPCACGRLPGAGFTDVGLDGVHDDDEVAVATADRERGEVRYRTEEASVTRRRRREGTNAGERAGHGRECSTIYGGGEMGGALWVVAEERGWTDR